MLTTHMYCCSAICQWITDPTLCYLYGIFTWKLLYKPCICLQWYSFFDNKFLYWNPTCFGNIVCLIEGYNLGKRDL